MTKIVDKKTCMYCESTYKLAFTLDETSGFAKFCPFCAAENYDEERGDFDDNNDE